MGLFNSKKGIGSWLPWILLVAFGVGLSFFMVQWIRDYSEGESIRFTRTVTGSIECDGISLHIDEIQQDVTKRELTMTVQNTGSLKINQLIFHFFDPGHGAKNTEVNRTINPNDDRTIRVLNPEFIVTSLEAVPARVTYIEDEGWIRILCPSRMIEVRDITAYTPAAGSAGGSSGPIECSVQTNSCTDSTCVLALTDIGDAHGELCSQGNYPKKVCCLLNEEGTLDDGGNCASKEDVVLSLSAVTDGHGDNRSQAEGGYPVDVCIRDTNANRKVECYTSSSCGNDACLVGLDLSTNAHLASCSVAGYPLKICCKIVDE